MTHLPQIGLDMGSSSIKLVELVATGVGKWKLITAAVTATNGAQVSEKVNLASMTAILTKIIRQSGVRGRRVVASLPDDKVSAHQLEIPLLADNEVELALTWQVEQYIPWPSDQAVWSYQVVKKDEVAGRMEVLLVAASKALVNAYRQVIEASGLEPLAFETELMAISRATVEVDSPLSVVVDIGAKSTDIGISRSGQLLFSRTVPTAGEAFTRAIETTLGLESAQAESYKNTYGFSRTYLQGKLLTAMRPVLDTIAAEIKKTVDFYSDKHAGETVKMAVLTGGVATLPDIVSALSVQLGLEVMVGNPLARVEVDAVTASALKGQEPFYAVAIGLAQRND